MTNSPATNDSEISNRQTKVARVIEEYELAGLGTEMERRWTAEGNDQMSLRDLADYFNKQLLAEVIDKTGGQLLPDEVNHLYSMLTGDDVSDADRMRVKRRLKRDGVDIDVVLQNFVTHQAVHTYLKRDRGAEYVTDGCDRKANAEETVQRLRGRVTSVIKGQLDQLRKGGYLTLGSFRVLIDIRVLCEECGTQLEIIELLTRGRCNCNTTES